ncbi:MAG: thioredoxin domain-containing protein [Byssovorax sp.]
MLSRSPWIAAVLGALCTLGCTPAASSSVLAPAEVKAPPPPPGPDPTRYHVLMVNGGGNPSINYQSHLVHLKDMRALLLASGVMPDQISILSGDGDDPAPDLATREVQTEPEFWRLASTRVGRRLDNPVNTVSSSIDGVKLTVASKANVGAWFEREGHKLKGGDILLLYVTDHGTHPNNEPLDNRIMLWGKDEFINVRELGTLVRTLPPGVRTVMLMSQCYSGAFAKVALGAEGGPDGNICGYFSSTADRPAYGCFLENKGKDAVGHSFHFTRALGASGRFEAAHEAVLSADVSPDVPLRTSDLYLDEVLSKAAADQKKSVAEVADEALRETLKGPPASWEGDVRLLDRVAQTFGTAGPRSLAELAEQSGKLPEVQTEVQTFERAWGSALADATSATFERFVRTHDAWAPRLADPSLGVLKPEETRALTHDLLKELVPFTAGLSPEGAQVEKLHARSEATAALAYRMAVRVGASLRLRALLTTLAGRAYLKKSGTPEQKKAYDALVSCEDLSLPRRVPAPPEPAAETASYPPFAEDLALAKTVLPAWLGVTFGEPPAAVRKKQSLEEGAAMVNVVYPDSPAKAAGLLPRDIVIGPPGHPFSAKNQLRTFTMLSAIDQPTPIEVLRDEARITINLVPGAYPIKWPSLPGPLAVGTLAPPVDLKPYRGPVAKNVGPGSAHLLYFWATWCGPCKAALPEVLAFEKERKIPVVAITDEEPEQLDAFFKTWKAGFPKTVAIDEKRGAFVSYGVSGTPTFVLVNDKTQVELHQTGYTAGKGLGIAGWKYTPPPAAPAASPAGSGKGG